MRGSLQDRKRYSSFGMGIHAKPSVLFSSFGRKAVFYLLCAVILGILTQPGTSQAAKNEIGISGWQGAQNSGSTFSVSVTGIDSGTVQFIASNCSVSPSNGSCSDSFKVRVGNAGKYTISAVIRASDGQEYSISCSGIAGKADQAPLRIKGWGDTRDYYSHFDIQVLGGSTDGTITFETDGCSVSPASGTRATLFRVTITRVGGYSLQARMEGDANYNPVYSVRQGGTAAKATQPPIEIKGWKETSTYGDVFTVSIAGGSTKEQLLVEASGCTVTKLDGSEYEISIDRAGPYTLSASRAGNYGYSAVSTYVSGIAKKAKTSQLTISGWDHYKNCNDAFPIIVRGGMKDAEIYFSTVGCTVTPPTGTIDTTFVVKIDTVGQYSLVAYAIGSSNYEDAKSRFLTGSAEKAVQNKVTIDGWNSSASAGTSFDIEIVGGNGTGALAVTTEGGCNAVLKDAEANLYTVQVTAYSGESYGVKAFKSGDASYADSNVATASGKAKVNDKATAITVVGWNSEAVCGDSFIITFSGGSGNGKFTFETEGCSINPPEGTINDAYTVTVTANAGETYSLNILRHGDGRYTGSTTVRSGSVGRGSIRKNLDGSDSEMPPHDSEMTVLLWIGCGIFFLFILVLLMFIRQKMEMHKRVSKR